MATVPLANLNAIKERFRAGGIPVFVEPDYSKRDYMATGSASVYSSATSSPSWYRINICLEEQLEEAKHLFEDANYEVKAPVDVAEFEATMERLGANAAVEWRISDKSLSMILGLILLGFVLWVLHAVLTSS